MDTIGDRIRAFANYKYGKINDFADAMGMGAPNVQAYMRGARKPGTSVMQKIQKLGCNIDWLLTGKGEMLEDKAVREEQESYHKDLETYKKQPLNGDITTIDKLFDFINENTVVALGKAMNREGIQTGDWIFLDREAKPRPGDLVLYNEHDYPEIKRYRDGDPAPDAIINRMLRNYRQPEKRRANSAN